MSTSACGLCMKKDAKGYRLTGTLKQLQALIVYWRCQGIDLEPERLVDVLPLLAAYQKERKLC